MNLRTTIALLALASCTAEVSAPPPPVHVASVSAPDKPLGPDSFLSTSCVPAGFHNSGTNEAWITVTAGAAQVANVTATVWTQNPAPPPATNTAKELTGADLRFDTATQRLTASCGAVGIQEAIFHLPAGVTATP